MDFEQWIAIVGIGVTFLGAFAHVVWLLSQIKNELVHIGEAIGETKQRVDELSSHSEACNMQRARFDWRLAQLERE